MDDMPIVTLSNGLRVANFSSPHPFTFVDGTILPACSNDRARALMLDVTEDINPHNIGGVDIGLIELSFQLSGDVDAEVTRLLKLEHKGFDLVLCPLPVLNAISSIGWRHPVEKIFVGIRIADRVTKTCYIDKFCQME